MTDTLKVYLTEFEYNGVTYDGPNIVAKNFKEAVRHADDLGIIVVGKLDTFIFKKIIVLILKLQIR